MTTIRYVAHKYSPIKVRVAHYLSRLFFASAVLVGLPAVAISAFGCGHREEERVAQLDPADHIKISKGLLEGILVDTLHMEASQRCTPLADMYAFGIDVSERKTQVLLAVARHVLDAVYDLDGQCPLPVGGTTDQQITRTVRQMPQKTKDLLVLLVAAQIGHPGSGPVADLAELGTDAESISAAAGERLRSTSIERLEDILLERRPCPPEKMSWGGAFLRELSSEPEFYTLELCHTNVWALVQELEQMKTVEVTQPDTDSLDMLSGGPEKASRVIHGEDSKVPVVRPRPVKIVACTPTSSTPVRVALGIEGDFRRTPEVSCDGCVVKMGRGRPQAGAIYYYPEIQLAEGASEGWRTLKVRIDGVSKNCGQGINLRGR